MALFNYATKEITLKIVYYGPGLSGKTTNLQHLHSVLNPETKGKLLSLSTEADRTLFFDFLPVELGKIRDFSIRFQLYTVPGQVRYNATRKVVLKGADAVVFVADSQSAMREQNIESYENMKENLVSNNINPDTIPVLLQYNKRDLNNILSIDELNSDLNSDGRYEVLEAVAINGNGVEETFKKITKLLLKDISKKHKIEIRTPEEKRPSETPEKPQVVAPPPKPEEPVVRLRMPEPAKAAERPAFEPATFVQDTGAFDIFPEDETTGGAIEPVEAIEAIEEEPAEMLDRWEVTEPPQKGLDLEFSIPVPEPAKEEIEPAVLPETIRAVPEPEHAPMPEPPSVSLPSFPLEKIDALSDDVANVSDRMLMLSRDISSLQKVVEELRSELSSIKSSVAVLNEKASQKEPEIRELKDIMKGQKEASEKLKDILEVLGSLKEKKSWFRL